jgi:hypothetical protein
METDRYARYGAATGIIAAILTVVGFFIFGTDIPATDASAQEWGSFFSDNQTQVQVGATLVGVGLFFLLWFLGSLRGAIAAAEGGAGRLASIAFGGGIIVVAFFTLAITGGVTAAFRPDQVDPNLTRALNDFGALAGAPASAGFAALFGAAAIAGYRYAVVPAPVAGLSALAAVTAPLAFGIVFTDSGVFAADGVLGLWVPFVTAVVALIALSWSLMRAATPAAAAAAPAAPPPPTGPAV